MLPYLRKLGRRALDRGASAVEYGLLVAAIAALIVIVVFALGGIIKGVFKKTCDTISSNSGTAGSTCAS